MKEQISSFLTGTVPYMLLPRKAPEALPTSLLYCDILTQEADGSVKAVMNWDFTVQNTVMLGKYRITALCKCNLDEIYKRQQELL